MIEGVVGQALLIEASLSDAATAKFPRAIIYDELTAVATTVDLVHVANGMYFGSWTPAAVGAFVEHFTVFSDSGHTVIDPEYERRSTPVLVRAVNQDTAFQKILGHLGENVRDDALSYDVNNRPLTMRRRIFATKAAAIASTPGGTGEGEIVTITGSAAHFDAAKWSSLLSILE